MSNNLQEDIERVIRSDLPWHLLMDATILITGASGLIGSNLVRVLRAVSDAKSLNIRIIEYTRKAYGDIRSPISVTEKVDYIVHCAALTSSSDMVLKPVETILTSIEGTKNILEFALKKQCRGVVYLSSMEVYGTVDKSEVYETDLGYLDLSNPRSSYPESKRMCENLCASYWKQYSVPIMTARLARTFGAGAPDRPEDNRVAMQFARKAINGEDIVLHTEGNSIANCIYTADAISGLSAILLKGAPGQAYNVSADSATIREMARMVAQDNGVNVIIDAPENLSALGYAPNVGYTLNTDKLKGLGWRPVYKLPDMFKRMIADWRET